MPRSRAMRRPTHRWCTLLLVTVLATGCSEPLTDATDSFQRCMESAGFAIEGMSAGLYDHGVGVDFDLVEPRLAVRAERVAGACLETASRHIGRRVFLEG